MVSRIRRLRRWRRADSLPTSTATTVAPLVHCCGTQNQVVKEGEEGRQLANIHCSALSSILIHCCGSRIRWLRREEGSLPTSTAQSVAPLVHCCGKQNQVSRRDEGLQLYNIHSTISSILGSLLWLTESGSWGGGGGQAACQHPQRLQQCPRFTAVVSSLGRGTDSFPPSTAPWVASCSLLWWAVPDVVEGVGQAATASSVHCSAEQNLEV